MCKWSFKSIGKVNNKMNTLMYIIIRFYKNFTTIQKWLRNFRNKLVDQSHPIDDVGYKTIQFQTTLRSARGADVGG